MLGSIETLDLVNQFKFIQAEEPNYKTSQNYEECCSSVKLRYRIWKKWIMEELVAKLNFKN